MRLLRGKKIVCVLLLLLGLSVTFLSSFWHKSLEWYLRSKGEELLMGDISIASTRWQGSMLIMENVHVASREGADFAKYELTVPKLTLDFSFSLWQREVFLDIALERPQGTFVPTHLRLLESCCPGDTKSHFLTFKPRIQIDGGILSLPRSRKVALSLDLDLVSAPKGLFRAHLQSSQQGTNLVEGTIKGDDASRMLLDLRMSQVGFAFAADIFSFWYPHLDAKGIPSGSFQGDALIAIEDKSFSIEQGAFEVSFMQSTGSLAIHSREGQPKLSLEWQGKVADLASIVPESIAAAVERQSSIDTFHIAARGVQDGTRMNVDGTLQLVDASQARAVVPFGLNLNTQQKDDKQLVALEKGWFHSAQLPLQTFISPFIDAADTKDLVGSADVQGAFDLKSLSVEYQSSDCSFENKIFSLDFVKNFGNSLISGKCSTDFLSGRSSNAATVQRGTYFEKNSGLVFTDVYADITVDQRGVTCSNVHAHCGDLAFSGAIALERSSLFL